MLLPVPPTHPALLTACPCSAAQVFGVTGAAEEANAVVKADQFAFQIYTFNMGQVSCFVTKPCQWGVPT